MSAIPCTHAINCPGSDFPISNFSSEGPEQVPQFYSLVFPESWDKQGCLSLCISEVSQEAANLCALAQAASCNPPFVVFDPPGGGGGGQDEDEVRTFTDLFFNSEQSCTVPCGDGESVFVVPAGTFSATTQLAADARAEAYACSKAQENMLCLGELSDNGTCAGASYLGLVGITSNQGVFVVSIIAGALPDGIFLNFGQQSFDLSGIATVPGQYDFTVQVIDLAGNSAERSYSLLVIDIADTSPLPQADLGQPYSHTLTSSGPVTGMVTWAVTAGALPTGLTLNSSTGLISGTPTVSGTFNFTISMTDEA